MSRSASAPPVPGPGSGRGTPGELAGRGGGPALERGARPSSAFLSLPVPRLARSTGPRLGRRVAMRACPAPSLLPGRSRSPQGPFPPAGRGRKSGQYPSRLHELDFDTGKLSGRRGPARLGLPRQPAVPRSSERQHKLDPPRTRAIQATRTSQRRRRRAASRCPTRRLGGEGRTELDDPRVRLGQRVRRSLQPREYGCDGGGSLGVRHAALPDAHNAEVAVRVQRV